MKPVKRLFITLVAWLLWGSALCAEPPTATTITSGSGLTETTLTRIDDHTGTLLIFRVNNEAMPLSDQGAALNGLLDQTIKRRALPDRFDVRLGGTRTALIKALQHDLLQPGANWNSSTGQPVTGELVSVLSHELTVQLVQSPIGMAFNCHGYTVRVNGLEHIEEEPKAFPRAQAKVPTDILVMEIVAERNQKP